MKASELFGKVYVSEDVVKLGTVTREVTDGQG